jgi:hypothetical protein
VFIGIDAMVFIQTILTLCLYCTSTNTLQRSIEQHEQSSDNPSTSPVNTTTNSGINSRMKEQPNNKILAVHDKITISYML